MIMVVLNMFVFLSAIFEPRHDKTNKVTVRPAKTQISLGIRPVWSVFAGRLMGSIRLVWSVFAVYSVGS